MREDNAFEPGHRLGAYEIRRCLGRGGMGAVYLARDHALDRDVALKTLHGSRAGNPGLVRRFRREARAAARLSHPNIVPVYAVGEEAGVPYLVMEYVDGVPLDQLIRREGALDWRRAMALCGQVAAALECAHGRGIIHRDIKPGNILVDGQGRARVTDFGVAKVLEASTQLTDEGTFIGTPQYMSPEQCGVGEMSPRSDLFSLGVLAYEMLSGTLPFRGKTPAGLIHAIVNDVQPPLPDHVPGLPEGVVGVVEGLLEKDPARRYPSAVTVLEDLRLLSRGQPLRGRDLLAAGPTADDLAGPLPVRGPASARRGFPVMPVVMGVVLAAVVGIAVLSLGPWRRGGASPEQPGAGQLTPNPYGAGTMRPMPGTRLRVFFKRADVNGDGYLDREEASDMMVSRQDGRRADADGDNRLSFEEVQAYVQEEFAERGPSGRGRMSGPRQGTQ